MRPQSLLTKEILKWIDQSLGWFSYWKLDSALGIEGKKAKTLRRVIIKRLCQTGKLIKAPDVDRVYKKYEPLKRSDWQ